MLKGVFKGVTYICKGTKAGKRILQVVKSAKSTQELTSITEKVGGKVIDRVGRGAILEFKIEGQLAKIWSDRRLFMGWIKSNCSLSRIKTPLNAKQAQQIIDNAIKFGINTEHNLKGLKGLETTGQWAGIPHFKIGNVHIAIEKGLEKILKFSKT